ncbi:Uncharacterised protein [Shigella sonnei]|nr:Uncharacterised protein [Shigella sonnei]
MPSSRLCSPSTARLSGSFFAGSKAGVPVSPKCKKSQRLSISSRRNPESVSCILSIKGFSVDSSSWLIFSESISAK